MAGGKIDLADGKIDLTCGKIDFVGGTIILTGGKIYLASENIISTAVVKILLQVGKLFWQSGKLFWQVKGENMRSFFHPNWSPHDDPYKAQNKSIGHFLQFCLENTSCVWALTSGSAGRDGG